MGKYSFSRICLTCREIDYDKIEKVSGLNIAIVTTANNDKEAKSLLTKLGMPFRK